MIERYPCLIPYSHGTHTVIAFQHQYLTMKVLYGQVEVIYQQKQVIPANCSCEAVIWIHETLRIAPLMHKNSVIIDTQLIYQTCLFFDKSVTTQGLFYSSSSYRIIVQHAKCNLPVNSEFNFIVKDPHYLKIKSDEAITNIKHAQLRETNEISIWWACN